MKIILIRHGQCDSGRKYIGSGTDISINSEGERTIREIANEISQLSNINPEYIISSSLRRSIETSEIISKKLRINIIVDKKINEIDFGIWDGLTYTEIMSKYREIAIKWFNDPFSVTPPNGEEFIQFVNRIELFKQKMKKIKNSIIVVTHGGVIQVLRTLIESDSLDNRWNYNIKRGEYLILEL